MKSLENSFELENINWNDDEDNSKALAKCISITQSLILSYIRPFKILCYCNSRTVVVDKQKILNELQSEKFLWNIPKSNQTFKKYEKFYKNFSPLKKQIHLLSLWWYLVPNVHSYACWLTQPALIISFFQNFLLFQLYWFLDFLLLNTKC